MEEILDALASSHFRSLRNYEDYWGISHLSFDGVSIAEIFGDHLDALLDTWVEVNKALEMHAEDNQRIAASETIRKGLAMDGFRNYDRWKLMSPEDEADERERQRLKVEDDMERADEMRDREKDEREERRQEAEMERQMLHGDD